MTNQAQEIKYLKEAILDHELMVRKLKRQNAKRSTLLGYYKQSIIEKRERIAEIEKGG